MRILIGAHELVRNVMLGQEARPFLPTAKFR